MTTTQHISPLNSLDVHRELVHDSGLPIDQWASLSNYIVGYLSAAVSVDLMIDATISAIASVRSGVDQKEYERQVAQLRDDWNAKQQPVEQDNLGRDVFHAITIESEVDEDDNEQNQHRPVCACGWTGCWERESDFGIIHSARASAVVEGDDHLAGAAL